jgi:flagellar hook assembly protein FlgD
MSPTVEASLEQVLEFDVRQNYPNPFNPTTTISYSIAERGHVTLQVYDASGHLVRTLIDEEQAPQAGGFTKVWNGQDDKGQRVASGVYFFRLSAGNRTLTKKLVVLK